MPTSPITTRLPDWLDEDIRGYWARIGERPSPGYRRIIEEWWTCQHLSELEFRDGVAGRRAGIRGGPDVWEVIIVARQCERDPQRIAEHFGGHLSVEAIRQALSYQERFGELVEAQIRDNERVERMLTASVR